jgi:DNA-binding transcriptional MocR family regulator
MKLNKQRNEYLQDYLVRTYASYLQEALRAEIGNDEYMKNIKSIREKCAEKAEWMMETAEHHVDEALGEFYEGKAVRPVGV